MYLDFFELKELPFRLAADPRYFYLGAGQEFAKSRLRTGLATADGCLLLTGEAGAGKTTLLHDLLNELSDQYTVVQLRNPEFSVVEFYQAVITQLQEAPAADGALREHFDGCLTRLAVARKFLLLAVDNGELVPQPLMDELLTLGRRTPAGGDNLRILLAGRPSIDKMMRGERSAARSVQVGMKVKLLPLQENETRQYVELRMQIAAGKPTAVFLEDAFPELQRYSGGVPRLINTLADAALMLAFNRNRESVSSVDIRSAVDHLKWMEFDSRTSDSGLQSISGSHRQPNAASDARAGHLCIECKGKPVADFDLPIGKISIGRALNNDVRIDSPFISRHHCHILTTAGYSVIEDLQSQNGVTVGTRRVSVHRLQDGDRVAFGDHALVYSRSDRAPSDKIALFPIILAQKSGTVDKNKTRVMKSQAAFPDPPDHDAD